MHSDLEAFIARLKKFWGRINAMICFFFGLGTLALGINLAQGDVGADAWVGMIFMLVMIMITGRVAWKHLYKIPRQSKQRSRDDKLRQIIHLAGERQGKLSALETALDMDLDIEESQELLDYLVDKGLALMHATDQGTMIFNFPDLNTRSPDLIALKRKQSKSERTLQEHF